jgi:hypothetical protein
MKTAWIVTPAMNWSFCSCKSQEKAAPEYLLGELAPGDSPVVFAPDKFNHPEGYHSSLMFTKDFMEVYVSPMTRYGEIQIQVLTRYENQ